MGTGTGRMPPPRGAAPRRAPGRPRKRRTGSPAWLVPAVGAAATVLLGTALLPDLAADGGTRPVDAAATAPVVAANGFSSSGGTGSIVIPAPAVAAPPSMIVPHPEVVRQAVVPPYVPRGVSPTTLPPPARCGGYSTPRKVTPAVVPGAGSATVSFPSDPSSSVRSYRVQAVSQHLVSGTQSAHVVATAGQQTNCGQVTVRLTGLASGDPYVFWLEEEQVDAGNGKAQFVQVGASEPVVIG
jgi:hypothetical protein